MSHVSPPSMTPIPAAERVATLDVLRGFALLGILLMNIEAFVGPLYEGMTGLDPTLTGADRVADALIYIFVQGKFYSLFSLLFGMGFAVMAQRADAAGRPFAGLYFRRSLVLLGIGLVHAFLIWSGDILVWYALLSFFLLAFRPLPQRWLPWLAIAIYLVPVGLMLLMGGLDWFMRLTPERVVEWEKMLAGQDEMIAAMMEGQRHAYGAGTYAEAVGQRASDMGFMLMGLMMLGPVIFGLFLLGMWFVRSGAIIEPERFPRLYTRLRWLALPVGLLAMLVSFAVEPTMEPGAIGLRYSVVFVLNMTANLLMALGYLAWIVRGMQSAAWSARLSVLAPAGRMALTLYLMQSLVCTWIFYGYGLGYFEQLSRAWQVPFVFALFAVQVALSHWWLRRFRFGPMEWVWRSLTYLKAQPMRRTLAHSA